MIPSCPKAINPATDMNSTEALKDWCKAMRNLERCWDCPEVTGKVKDVVKKKLPVNPNRRLF
jgi:hypothetical protein